MEEMGVIGYSFGSMKQINKLTHAQKMEQTKKTCDMAVNGAVSWPR